MNQYDTLLVSSPGMDIQLLSSSVRYPVKKKNHAFAPTLCPGEFLFAKNCFSDSLSKAFLVELARMHPSHLDNIALEKMLPLLFLLLRPFFAKIM